MSGAGFHKKVRQRRQLPKQPENLSLRTCQFYSEIKVLLRFFILVVLLTQNVSAGAAHRQQPLKTGNSELKPPAEPEPEKEKPASPRQAYWRQQRLEKLKHIVVPPPTKVERVFLWVEKHLKKEKSREGEFPTDKSLLGIEKPNLYEVPGTRYKRFYPRFGTVRAGSALALGARYWKPNFKEWGLDFQTSAAYSFHRYQWYEVELGKIQQNKSDTLVRSQDSSSSVGILKKKHRSFIYADFRYRDFPREDFFGLGAHSMETDRTNFALKEAFYGALAGYQWTRRVGTSLRLGLTQVDVNPGTNRHFPSTQEQFDDLSAPGLSDQPDFLQLNSALYVDYRDNPGHPRQGGLIRLTFSRFDDRGGSEFEFNRFALDVRHYLALGSPQRVLATRFLTSHDSPGRSSRVPFYLQETLGGRTRLRGFRNYRFRDTRLLYLSAEYRWEAVPALEFAVFYDAGKVFSDRSDFTFSGLEKSIGGGIRLKTQSATFLRFDVGRSREGVRFHLKVGPSF